MAKSPKTITAYKGFDKDWKCRDFQYEVGKSYKHNGDVKACNSGFHACEAPFDVWGYYGPLESKFALVEMSGKTNADGKDTKVASANITIKAELNMPDFIKTGIKWLVDNTKGKDDTGNSAKIGSSGNSAQIGSSGDYAKIGSSGDYAQIGSSGDSAQIGSSGHSAQIGSSGHSAQIEATGKNSVIASSGYNARVKAEVCTHIAVAEYVDGECVGFATGCIGEDGLSADVWYIAKSGKLVEE